jgi:hypothetical protein
MRSKCKTTLVMPDEYRVFRSDKDQIHYEKKNDDVVLSVLNQTGDE